MARKAKTPNKYQICIDVRKTYHLSHAHMQMARELGMNPKKFGKIAHHKQEPWKAPVPVLIENLCFKKRFGKKRPGEVKRIEHVAKRQRETWQTQRSGETRS